MCFRQQIDSKRWVKTPGIGPSLSLKCSDEGKRCVTPFLQVCDHEGVSSSSRYVFVKKTIADLLQTDSSLHEHSDSGGW